jgi:hypothetical protein
MGALNIWLSEQGFRAGLKGLLDGMNVFYSPASVTKNVGGTLTGAVSTVQTMLDGNIMSLVEATGAPGYDLQFDWTGISFTPTDVVARLRYDGATTHIVTLDLWNYNSSVWVSVSHIETSDEYELRTYPIPNFTNFISGGAVKVRLYHATAGNIAHTLYVDYIGLRRLSTS